VASAWLAALSPAAARPAGILSIAHTQRLPSGQSPAALKQQQPVQALDSLALFAAD